MERFRQYVVRWERVQVGGREYELLMPANSEALLEDPRVLARFERDEYMPYWANLWPAAKLLAREVAAWPLVAPGEVSPEVVELGCGLGLVGLVAAQRGYRVTLSDHDEDALAFAVESARRNGITPPATRILDWRETYADVRPERILAADVLYEQRHLAPLAAFVREHLAPGGFALLADPGRGTADQFPCVAEAAGLRIGVQVVPAVDGWSTGRLFRVER
jgi:SAM-dependent methyltransferase